jgi:hypothetical protein
MSFSIKLDKQPPLLRHTEEAPAKRKTVKQIVEERRASNRPGYRLISKSDLSALELKMG